PADAVTTEVFNAQSQTINYRLLKDDGSAACYQSCKADGSTCQAGFRALTNSGENVLRYNTELATCPDKFRARANYVAFSSVNIEINLAGESRNVTIRAIPDMTHRSLFAYPVVTEYYKSFGTGGELNDYQYFGPQLYAVSNRKEIGTRTVIVAEGTAGGPVTFSGLNDIVYMKFDGPGTKLVSIYPQPGKRIIIFEKLPGTQGDVIYVSDRPEESYITDVAEYEEMRATAYASFPADVQPWMDYVKCTRNTWINYAHGVADNCILIQAEGAPALTGTPADYDSYKDCAETRRATWVQALETCRDQKLGDKCPNHNANIRDCLLEYAVTYDESDPTKEPLKIGTLSFDKKTIQTLIDEGRTVANETVFWRSNNVSMWCDTGCGDADRTPGNWQCCRPKIDDWRNITNTTLYEQHACTFCNNSYHPGWDCNAPNFPTTFVRCTYNSQIPLLQCDQRCTKTGDFGSAQINYSEYFVANLS
ncbi:hypothetical protein COU36_01970, partial [Candidatus Micrarchaeota archaeon CG10_big_fil_rev_8_21_14_0_10_59_7]